MAQALPPLQPLLDEITEVARASENRGKVADYIPELAGVDPDQFGIAIARPGQPTVMAGDAQVPFSKKRNEKDKEKRKGEERELR